MSHLKLIEHTKSGQALKSFKKASNPEPVQGDVPEPWLPRRQKPRQVVLLRCRQLRLLLHPAQVLRK